MIRPPFVQSQLMIQGQALVLLGCPVGKQGLSPVALRRTETAARVWHAGALEIVVASGGRTWHGRVEADVLAEKLAELGVPRDAIVRERCSMNTTENAQYTARILERRGMDNAVVVTCAWHLPRALRAFHKHGLDAKGVGVPLPDRTALVKRAYLNAREVIASWLDR